MFFYEAEEMLGAATKTSFSPPKGIHCFSTWLVRSGVSPLASVAFQSPEGDSLFFYQIMGETTESFTVRFSPPKGIHCFSTQEEGNVNMEEGFVSVPRRGFIVFLPG